MHAWVIGNWKQNPATSQDVDILLDDLLANVAKKDQTTPEVSSRCQLMVAPSFIHLADVSTRLKDSLILCAAQDISAHSPSTGAYTGDCSAQQVSDAGAKWTILGHSERRQYHQESQDCLLHKMTHAIAQDMGVVFCIGETQTQYDAKETLDVVDEQLSVIKALLAQQPDSANLLAERLIVAYEPVWAIGTGKVPTVEEVSKTHQHIKQTVAGFADSLGSMTVLYGGSVNADNADSFAADSMIDGALVGGASLKADSFLAIADAFDRASL
ncbi:triose-phosphate isomerase [Psychrobacter sp.]|uniref:triose-phosphate isomerase n=1 Tax=Psychrobacter sp. TaxID=56811 RepID=UPI00264908BF|nr:triose-phosphate isomerase [Psychrobacter sp.]MDN6276850.1 triose-phosphate isomerase [Psychrobacter sp.]MDN6308113.1 triose-phosphate isomerase [Psychrobacter sp.]